MIYALDPLTNTKIKAEPGLKGICQECRADLIARCGSINVWHWAHTIETNCDAGMKIETPWHLAWKSLFNVNNVEVLLPNGKIADVKLDNGLIIEFQNSRMANEKFDEYEAARPNMIWLINGNEFCKNLFVSNNSAPYSKFKWNWVPKTLVRRKHPIYIDLNGDSQKIFGSVCFKGNGKYGWGYNLTLPFFFSHRLGLQQEFMDLPLMEWNLSNKGMTIFKQRGGLSWT